VSMNSVLIKYWRVRNKSIVVSKVQNIVDQVQASGCLGKSSRQCDLLQYLLAEMEQGRLDKITPFSVAIDVLGRDDSFDSTTDSIVRVEMHRLRKNLKHFNGTSKNLHLVIPRASYEVVVIDRPQKHKVLFFEAYLKQFAFTVTVLAAVVTGFFLTQAPNNDSIVTASNCSSAIPNISVVNSGDVSSLQLHVDRIIRSTISQYTSVKLVEYSQACEGTPSFVIDYMVLGENSKYRVAMTTYNTETSSIIKQANVGGIITQLDGRTNLHFDIAKSIDVLVKPYGTIPKYAATLTWGSSTYKDNYRCLITMYDSFSGESSAEYAEALSCLERSAETDLVTLDNLGGLAASYLEQAQGYRAKTVDAPLFEAEKIISKFKGKWINSVEMTIAKITYEVERPDFNSQRLKALLDESESRYDSHPQILLTVAGYSGYKLGDWEHAKHLSDRVKLLHAELDNSVYVIDAAYSLLFETNATNMQTCKMVYSENSLLANLIVHACAKQSQNSFWYKKTQANLDLLNYSSPLLQINFIQNKGLEASLSDGIIAALKLPPV